MDELSIEELDQLMAVFREQTSGLLDDMSQDLLALEAGEADLERLLKLRRAAHTIKGDAGCLGLESISAIAHEIEDEMERMTGGGESIESGSLDSIFKQLDLIKALLMQGGIRDADENKVNGSERLTDKRPGEGTSENGGIGPEQSGSQRPMEKAKLLSKRNDFVRIEAEKVDLLLNLAGELVLTRSVIDQLGPDIEHSVSDSELVARLATAHAQMGKLITEVQKRVLKMRMTTIAPVFKRFARPMRRLAAEKGKQVELSTTGGETELDRALVELLYEPLLHLLRNAVDHGIEEPEERRRLGKREHGLIEIHAYHEGNQIVVEVSDDGRGIDVDSLKTKAIDSGVLINEGGNLSEDDLLDMIFLPGLSTAGEITEVSGRGIGMSAVKAAVEQMRGNVSVRSARGRGTTFTLRLPLTLAIIRGLLFTSSGLVLALPLQSVCEIVSASVEEIVQVDGLENYRLRDRLLSLVRPGRVFGYDRRVGGYGAGLRGTAANMYIIVISAGGKKYGVIAEAVSGEQELVIKSLESDWVQNDAVTGASILGDGQVVLILDAEKVFRKAIRYERFQGEEKGAYAIN
jgi:two-component system chemotaxis sensor kinase CheA